MNNNFLLIFYKILSTFQKYTRDEGWGAQTANPRALISTKVVLSSQPRPSWRLPAAVADLAETPEALAQQAATHQHKSIPSQDLRPHRYKNPAIQLKYISCMAGYISRAEPFL